MCGLQMLIGSKLVRPHQFATTELQGANHLSPTMQRCIAIKHQSTAAAAAALQFFFNFLDETTTSVYNNVSLNFNYSESLKPLSFTKPPEALV